MAASTRVFISATSGDLGSVRQLVKEALLSMDCHPVEQTNFPPDYRTVREILTEKISHCQAVLHIVGQRYGAEPDPAKLPEGTLGRSYTQMEYDLARQLNKKVYVFLCRDEFSYDQCEAESDEQQQLQQAHRDTLSADEQLRTEVDSREELGAKVRELQIELNELRGQVRRSTSLMLAGITLLIVVLAGVIYGVMQLGENVDVVGKGVEGVGQQVEQLGSIVEAKSDEAVAEIRKLYEDPDVLTGKLKRHIRKRADEEIAVAKARKADWRKRDEIEKRRDTALSRIDDLVATIRDGLAGKPDPIFAEAARILAEKGVDEALAFLEAKQPAIESRVKAQKARRDQALDDVQQAQKEFHETLEPWLLEADLHKSNLAFDKARDRYEMVAGEAPQWSRARRKLGSLLNNIAEFENAETHLKVALDLAEDDHQRASATNSLGLLYVGMARWSEAEPLLKQFLKLSEDLHGPDSIDTAAALSNLAHLLHVTNRLSEAELLMRRGLAVNEQTLRAEHPDITVHLNNLAQLLVNTSRLAEAEPLMRRALAIDEQSLGTEHPKVVRHVNNLVALLQATDRVAQAVPLMRRVLTVNEQAFGSERPEVALDLNNLAELLRVTNRLAEAEPLYRRALAIDGRSFGNEHPNVARDLNNLAQLLRATNRLAEAEPLYRRALVIDEQSLGAEHSEFALKLWNFAVLLRDTGRLSKAIPLMQRSVDIYGRFASKSGYQHPYWENALGYYRAMLKATELSEDEIAQRVRNAGKIAGPLTSIVPEVERLLGPSQPVDDVLTALDRKYIEDGKPQIYFLSPNELIAPHLDELLDPAKSNKEVLAALDAQYREKDKPPVYFLLRDEPIAPHLDELLGPAKSTKEVLAALDEQHRKEGISSVWFLPLDEPISPHLDELLGPLTK